MPPTAVPRPAAATLRAGHGERGTAVAELAVVAPLLVIVLLAVVFAGRLVQAEGRVEGAARDAARAASVRRTPAAAIAAATTAAGATLGGGGLTCGRLAVTVDTGRFVPGGGVTATVTCTVSLADLGLLGVPGSLARSATAAAPIELYRGVGVE
jgi:Flp pilus assembly protein TadG